MIDLRSQTPKGRLARDTILVAAEELFTTHGFHGASVRDVAASAGLPLATVVYHFAKKEQLYAAVLDAIGSELLDRLDALDRAVASGVAEAHGKRAPARSRIGGKSAEARVDAFAPARSRIGGELAEARVDALARALVQWTREQPGRVQLLLRELLDNPARVTKATRLPLAPFLERATEIVAAAQRARVLAAQPPELAVLHLVGALSYVVAARPTVDRIIGRARARALAASYEAEALAVARRILGRSP
jgi:AcrR family transcriptional regulator